MYSGVQGSEVRWIEVVAVGQTLRSISIQAAQKNFLLGPLLFILYTSEMSELLMKIRLYAYADDSTLLAVVRKPADRPAVAASLNKGLARIQEWCNHWCMILNPSKTKALVISRSRTVNPPMVTWSCLGFSFALVPTSIFFAWCLTGSISKTMWPVLSLVSLKELIFWGWWSVSLWTPLCCFVPNTHLFSQS